MKTTCPICGGEFRQNTAWQKYDTNECRLIAWHLNKYREKQQAAKQDEQRESAA
jgi:hypothetical protein